jgi:hypothetical protein
LRQALRGKPSAELRRRVGDLLQRLVTASPQRLRALRSLELLEGMNTAESRLLLQSLAGGAPDAWLTREAKAALDRQPRP